MAVSAIAAKAANYYPPVSSYFPPTAKQNTPFEVKINYGQIIDCGGPFIQNVTGTPHISNGTCIWTGWEGLNATFNCTVPKRGDYSLYSYLFPGTGFDCQESYDYIGNINVIEASLLNATVPAQITVDQSFQLECNYGMEIDCISGSVETYGCLWVPGVPGFQCTPRVEGTFDVYCNQFSGSYYGCPDKSERAGTITVGRGTNQLPPDIENAPITKKISGSFFLLPWFTLTEAQWISDLRNTKSLGMDTLILSDYISDGTFNKFLPFLNAVYFLNEQEQANFNFFFSLPYNHRDSMQRSYITSEDNANNMALAANFYSWYKTNYVDMGKPDILAGWNFGSEPDMSVYNTEVETLYTPFKNNGLSLKQTYPNKKTIVTPYLTNNGTNIGSFAQFFSGSMDIFAVQDGAGGQRSIYTLENFMMNVSVVKNYGIEFWTILETFVAGKPYTSNIVPPTTDYRYYPFKPARIERVISQLKIEQKYADKIISWDYQLDMSPLNLGRDNEQFGLQAALFSSYFNQVGCANGFCNPWENYTCSQDCSIHDSDTNPPYGLIDMPELNAFLYRWKLNSSDVTIRQIIEAIGLWKRG